MATPVAAIPTTEDHRRGPPPERVPPANSPPSRPISPLHPDDTTCHPRSRSERDVDFDRDVLHRGVRDAGRWAYGTVLAEVWVWNERGTHLVRPPGGWWLDPVFHAHQHQNLPGENPVTEYKLHSGIHAHPSCPLCRLTDPSLSTFEPPKPLSLGEGIPGVLWEELKSQGNSNAFEGRMSLRRIQSQKQRQLVWRQVQAIADDPDQPFNPRLKLLAQRLVTKIGWAAAVSFDIQGSQGLVVYYARAGVCKDRLSTPTNENYLVSAAQLIGAAYALRKPRQASVALRREELAEAMERVKRKIRQVGKDALRKDMTGTGQVEQPLELEPVDHLEAQTIATTSASKSCRDYPPVQWLESNAIRIFYKVGGGNVQPPPAFNWIQTIWTFVGVFTTLVLLTWSNTRIVGLHGSDHAIVMGPFGALMTLMFGLTGAPASQPRNALLGQTISISVAIGISQIESMEPWMQQSLATALAVTSMVKLGITHPPAGAAALLFASGKFGWYNLLSVLLGNLVAIAAATLINDINPERQYPTYWGAQQYIEMAQDYLLASNAIAPEKDEVSNGKQLQTMTRK